MSANLTITDLFAGAGGSSTGAVSVPGVAVRLAANHWQRAVDVHNANHPSTDHLCADISQIDPRYVPTTDLLWASPECTNHSVAQGRKRADAQPDLFGESLPPDAAERSRATMWDVVRFTEAHRYRAVIVENVVDAANWQAFPAWLMAMDVFGYEHKIVYLNSMHAQAAGLPAPQSRDRMYVVFWRRGERRPDLDRYQRPRAWCPTCEQVVAAVQSWKRPDRRWGRYRAQYVYRCPRGSCRNQIVEPGWLPAASAIDWSLPGTRIGDRPRALADKTRRRIAAGIARYWREPFVAEVAGNTYERRPGVRTWPVDEVLRTLHTTASKALLVPVEGRDGKEARAAEDVLRTLTTRAETALAYAPFIAELRGGGSTARPTDQPMATVTASGNHHALVTPYYGNGNARLSGDPLSTVTSVDRHALVTPAGGSWNESARSSDDVFRTMTTSEAYALVMRNNNVRGDQGAASTPVHETLRTITTAGHQSLITPGDVEAAEAQVDDCLFRMLEPSEVAAGMAFPADYQWEGTRRERVRMAGNAVTPPAARDLVAAVAEAITGDVEVAA